MSSTNWVPIPGYQGRYEVSDAGEVRRTSDGRILAHHLIGPYHRVCLWDGSKSWRYMVHRLVAAAFIGPCPDGYEVNHRDGDPSNNAVSNLEYVTPKENVRHSFTELGRRAVRGEGHGQAVLTEDMVIHLRREHSRGSTASSLARKIGVDPATVQRVVTRRTWRHVP